MFFCYKNIEIGLNSPEKIFHSPNLPTQSSNKLIEHVPKSVSVCQLFLHLPQQSFDSPVNKYTNQITNVAR
jgi:hypothetical protein